MADDLCADCGHVERGHLKNGCVDWDARGKCRCQCETFRVAAIVIEPKTEGPTDEQLCNLAAALGFPMLASPFLRHVPHWRQSMLYLHALVQRSAYGDAEASRALDRVLERLKEADELVARGFRPEEGVTSPA